MKLKNFLSRFESDVKVEVYVFIISKKASEIGSKKVFTGTIKELKDNKLFFDSKLDIDCPCVIYGNTLQVWIECK